MTTKAAQKKLEQWRSTYTSKGWAIDERTGCLVPKHLKKSEIERRTTLKSATVSTKMAFDVEGKLEISGVANEKTTDRMNEILEPTGVQVNAYLQNAVLLWQHMHGEPIGLVSSLRVEESGVHFDAWIGDPKAAPLTRRQIEARSLVAQKIIKAVSVGFIPLEIKQPTFDNNGAMVDPALIERWEMLELSLVSVPCNPGALFDMKDTSEKSAKIYSFPTLGADGKFLINDSKKALNFPTLGEDGKFKLI